MLICYCNAVRVTLLTQGRTDRMGLIFTVLKRWKIWSHSFDVIPIIVVNFVVKPIILTDFSLVT